jgi:O-antigen/teichoic acid export membrane protein
MSTDARHVSLLSGPERRAILRDSVAVLSSSHFATACGVLLNLVVRSAIGPALAGVWTTMRTLLEYGSYSSLGINRAAGLQIAVAAGCGDQPRMQRLADVAMTVELLTAGVVAVSLAAAGAFHALRDATTWSVAFATAAGIAVVSRYHAFNLTVLRSRKQFPVLARARVFGAVSDLVLLAGAAYCFGFYGLLVAALLAHSCNAWYVRHAGRLRFAPAQDGPLTGQLLAAGWPIAAEALALAALRSVDRLVILGSLPDGQTQLGWYSIAIMLGAWAFDQSNLIANVIYPRLAETLGRTNDPQAVLRLGLRAAEVVALVMVIVSALLLVAGIRVVEWLLPAFRPGLVAAVGLVTAAAVLGACMPLRYALITIGRTRPMLVATGLCAALSLGAGFALVAQSTRADGSDLAWLAWNSAAAAGLCLVFMLGLCCVHAHELRTAAIRVLAAAAYVVVGAALVARLRGNTPLELFAAVAWSAGPAWLLVQRVDWNDLLRRRSSKESDVPDVTDIT